MIASLMPRTTTRQRGPTQLSEMVKAKRELEGWTQQQLDAQLGLKKQYVAKLESGRIKVPGQEILGALAQFLGVSTDHLARAASRTAGEQADGHALVVAPQTGGRPSPTLRLVFGHCTWAAPIVLALANGHIRDVNLLTASFAPADDADELVWWSHVEFERLRDPDATVEVPTPRRELKIPLDPGAAPPVPLAEEKKVLATISARRALRLLELGKAEMAVIPASIINREDPLDVLATIVDSATGCTFISRHPCQSDDHKDSQTTQDAMSTSELAQSLGIHFKGLTSLDGSSTGNPRPMIAAESRTVAADYLKDIARHLGKEARDLHWSVDTALLQTHSFKELELMCQNDVGGQLLGVVAWEPHASWICHRQDPLLLKRLLQLSPSVTCAPLHLTFDLVVHRQSTIPMRDLWHIVAGLWKAAGQIRRLDGLHGEPADAHVLCRYFSLLAPGQTAVQPVSEAGADGSVVVAHRAKRRRDDTLVAEAVARSICPTRFRVSPDLGYRGWYQTAEVGTLLMEARR